MNQNRRLAKNTIIYAIGIFGTKFLNFILLPLYTYYLSTQDYGFFDLLITFITLITPIITFMLDNGVYRYLLDCENNKDKKQIISNSLFRVMINLIIFIIIFLVTSIFIKIKFEYAILAQIILTVIESMFLQITRGLKYNKIYSFNSIIIALIIVISNIICLRFFKLGVLSLIISNIVGNLISIIYLNSKIKILSYINFRLANRNLKKELIRYSLPLIPNTISWWIMNVSDRLIINENLGTSANGIYAVSNKLPAVLTMVNYVFYLAWQESAITTYSSKDKNEFYTNIFYIYIKLQFTALFVLLSFTDILFKIMIKGNFGEAYAYVPFLYLGAVFYSFASFYGVFYDSSKHTGGSFLTSIIGAIVNIIFNILMIPKYGLQIASISTFLSFCIMWIIRVIDTKKYVKIDINYKILGILSVLTIVYMYVYYLDYLFVRITFAIVAIILAIIFNKEIIYKLLSLVKNLSKRCANEK